MPRPYTHLALPPVGLARKPAAVARGGGRPGACDAPAEQRRAKHGAFEPGAAVDVAARHAGNLAGGIEARDRLEMPVEHAALQIGLHATEILAREREQLNGVIGWRVERFRG